MRSAPCSFGSRNYFVSLGAVALFGITLAACGSSSKKPDGGLDAGASDTRPDVPGSDVHVVADVRPDIRPDLPPPDLANPLCQGTSPTNDYSDPYVIADFNNDNDQTFGGLNSSGLVVPGATYTTTPGYPVADYSALNWHLTATVGPTDDAHFGLYWQCSLPTAGGGCTLDISGFKGISFKIKGYAGPDNAMTLSLGRAQNDPAPANAGCGSCVLPTDSDAAIGDYCRGPRADFAVPADGSEKTVTLLWTDFANGSPHDSIDPHQVTGFLWIFHNPPAAGDGGTDASDASDAPADAPLMSSDAGDGSANMSEVEPVDAGADEVGPPMTVDAGAPGYAADITIDDITLVPF